MQEGGKNVYENVTNAPGRRKKKENSGRKRGKRGRETAEGNGGPYLPRASGRDLKRPYEKTDAAMITP